MTQTQESSAIQLFRREAIKLLRLRVKSSHTTLVTAKTLVLPLSQINIMKEKPQNMKLRNDLNTETRSSHNLKNQLWITSNRGYTNNIQIGQTKLTKRSMCIWLLIRIWNQVGRRLSSSITQEQIKVLMLQMLNPFLLELISV